MGKVSSYNWFERKAKQTTNTEMVQLHAFASYSEYEASGDGRKIRSKAEGSSRSKDKENRKDYEWMVWIERVLCKHEFGIDQIGSIKQIPQTIRETNAGRGSIQ